LVETRKSIVIDAPSPVVFKAITDEAELVQWMHKEARMDLRVGGEYEFKFYWAEANITGVAKGKILELIPNKKISYTFDATYPGFDRRVEGTVVTWTLDELPEGKTKVTLVHTGVDWAGHTYWLQRLESHCREMAAKARTN
jgi:uncharacterized protein YndB with AHSA1/START domain